MDTEYKNKCFRELLEAIWKFQGSVDELVTTNEAELAKVIYAGVKYPSLVSGAIDDIIEAKKNITL